MTHLAKYKNQPSNELFQTRNEHARWPPASKTTGSAVEKQVLTACETGGLLAVYVCEEQH